MANNMRIIKIKVDPPELIFVEDEPAVMLLDTIEITPQAGCVEYFGKGYEVSNYSLIEKGRWGMQKFDKLNMVGPVNEDNKYQ